MAEALEAAARGAAAACSSTTTNSGASAAESGAPFLLLQLPRYLPPVDRAAMVQQDARRQQQHQPVDRASSNNNSSSSSGNRNEPLTALEELPTGRLGQLVVRRSGRVTLKMRSCSPAAVPAAVPAGGGGSCASTCAASASVRTTGDRGLEFGVSLGCNMRSVLQCGILLQNGAEFVILGERAPPFQSVTASGFPYSSPRYTRYIHQPLLSVSRDTCLYGILIHMRLCGCAKGVILCVKGTHLLYCFCSFLYRNTYKHIILQRMYNMCLFDIHGTCMCTAEERRERESCAMCVPSQVAVNSASLFLR